jgi:hypothetical protein
VGRAQCGEQHPQAGRTTGLLARLVEMSDGHSPLP